MDHPSIASVLAHVAGGAPDALVADHLAACAPCRGLAGVGDPFGERALVELGESDPALYGCREALRDAQSGMGRAIRAWDRRIGRDVVIKQIRALDGVALDGQRARFEREARLTARLQHPGIVGVLELGRWPDGEPYYTMPLIEGEPLDEAIARATTPAARLALVAHLAFAAEAIAFAHDRGVVHRDLKPANILIGRFGETIVIDWGLARPLGEPGDLPAESFGGDDGLTRIGVGTPGYMPPEQAAGAEPDRRVDVYALGATLYHVLAGTPPYAGGDGAIVRARLRAGPPRPLAEVAPDAPPALIAVVDKAMAREPDDRFTSALELALELRRFTSGQLLHSHQYRSTELLRHWLRRHRAAVRVAAAAGLVLVAVAALSVSRIVRERDHARVEQARALRSERDARTALAGTRLAQARGLAEHPTTRLDALAIAASAVAELAPADPAAWQGLIDVLGAGPIAVALPATVSHARFAPSGTRFATLDGTGQLAIWDASAHPLGSCRSTLGRPLAVTWADDGARLVIAGLDRRAEIVDVDTLARRAITVGPADGDETLVGFRSDGLVATASGDELALWDPATGDRRGDRTIGCRAAALVTARRLVVVACGDGELVAWDGADGLRAWPVHGGQAAVSTAPDAATLYSAGDDGRALAWSTATIEAWLAGAAPPSPRVLIADAGTRIYRVNPWPDGRTVSVAHGATTILGVADGIQIEDPQRTAESSPVPGGRRLFGHEGGREVIAWDLGSREVIVRLAGHRPFATAELTAARDGDRAIAITSRGEAWLWDARLGTAAGALPGHDGEIVAIASDERSERAVVASLDGLVRTVDLADGAIRESTRLPSELVTAAFDDAGRFAVVTAEGDHRALALAMTPAPRPSTVVVTGGTGRLELRPPVGPVRILAAAGPPVIASAVSVDGAQVVTADASGEVRVWAVTTGRLWTVPDGGEGLTTALAITADGRWLLLGHASGAVRVVPLTLAAARARLCATLAGFGRAAAGCPLTERAAGPSR